MDRPGRGARAAFEEDRRAARVEELGRRGGGAVREQRAPGPWLHGRETGKHHRGRPSGARLRPVFVVPGEVVKRRAGEQCLEQSIAAALEIGLRCGRHQMKERRRPGALEIDFHLAARRSGFIHRDVDR